MLSSLLLMFTLHSWTSMFPLFTLMAVTSLKLKHWTCSSNPVKVEGRVNLRISLKEVC